MRETVRMNIRRVLLLIVNLGALAAFHVRAAPPPVPALGFIGDSITHSPLLPERTPELVGELLGMGVVNRGIGGTTTADWLPEARTRDFPAALAAFRAGGVRVVQVALGTNDALHAVAPALYAAHLACIVRALTRAGYGVVLADPPSMVTGSMDGYVSAPAVALLASYRPILATVGGRLGETDAAAYFRAHPDQLQDGVHPGPDGSPALAGLWAVGLTDAR